MADVELKLLGRMTTEEGLAHVLAVGLRPEVFVDLMARAAFKWVLDDYAPSGAPPTPAVYEIEFPALRVPPAASIAETTDWLVSHLQQRHLVNEAQTAILSAADTLNDDPVATINALIDGLGSVRDQAGKTGPSFDDEFLLADQLDCLPAPEPLITDVLTRHAYGILRGRDATFKSFMALDWSLCLATDTPWQSKAVDPVRVLYVAGEGAHGVAARMRAWELATGTTVDPKQFVVRRSAVNLYRVGPEFDHLLAYIRDGEFGLVVLDTLRRMSGGAEGNGSDMGIVVDNIERIKRETANGSVLVITHTDKGDHDSRGFSGIEDDADLVWSSAREANTNEVTLTCAKMKDGPDGHRFQLRLRPEGESLVVEAADPVGRSNLFAEDPQAVQVIMTTMREVFAVDGATVKDLVEVTGLAQASIYRARARLLESGRLTSNGAHRMFLRATEVVSDG